MAAAIPETWNGPEKQDTDDWHGSTPENDVHEARSGSTDSGRMSGWHPNAMDFVAIRILTGDRGKYLGLIFAIALISFLIAQQNSVFMGLTNRTRSQIRDIGEGDLWVMDLATRYVDEVYPLRNAA